MKICPAGAEFFQADRHDEANCRFSQFANAHKNKIFSMSGISAQDHFLLQSAVSCSTVLIQ
jgi:hypothetical protein